MYDRACVAVVSATTAVTPLSLPDILFAEVDSISGLYQHQENLLQRMHVFRSEYYTPSCSRRRAASSRRCGSTC